VCVYVCVGARTCLCDCIVRLKCMYVSVCVRVCLCDFAALYDKNLCMCVYMRVYVCAFVLKRIFM